MRNNFLLIAAIFSIFITTNSCTKGVEPDNTNNHNKILFTSNRSGNKQLYSMNPDGTDIKQITSGEYSHSSGKWSPDVSKVFCNTSENSTTAGMQMVVMSTEGTNRQLLGIGSQMTWSPNANKIVYWICPSCEFGNIGSALFIIDIDGQNNLRLPVDGGSPDWSPNGDRIIFNAMANPGDSTSHANMEIMNYPNFEITKSIGPNGAGYPAWSPNGAAIAFCMTSSVNGVSEIFCIDTSSAHTQQITSHTTLEHYIYPRWSADGSQIIFIAYAIDGTQRSFLYVINQDGKNLHKAIDDSTITYADWSK